MQNQRMRDQEWAVQSMQILDLLPKLERSVMEMEKEKRGYLLTGDANYADALQARYGRLLQLSRLSFDPRGANS